MAFIKKTITRLCVIFSACVLVMCAYVELFGGNEIMLSPPELMSLFAYAAVLSALSAIPSGETRGGRAGIRAAAHFLISAAAFYLIFILAGGLARDMTATLARMMLFCAVYGLSAAVYYSVKLTRRNRRGEDEYKEQFAALREAGKKGGNKR